MIWIAWCIAALGGLASGTVLVLNGHPWFALLAMMLPFAVSINYRKGEDTPP